MSSNSLRGETECISESFWLLGYFVWVTMCQRIVHEDLDLCNSVAWNFLFILRKNEKLANFKCNFRHEGMKYQGYMYIYSESSILVLSENQNRFHLILQELWFFFSQRFHVNRGPGTPAPSHCRSKLRGKTNSVDFLSKIFGFLGQKTLPGPIFRYQEWKLLFKIRF